MPEEPEPTPDELLIDGIVTALKSDRHERLSVGLNFTPRQNAILREAARERNLSLAAYVRRAALCLAAYDLGFTMEYVREDEQVPRSYVDPAAWAPADTGPWRIGQVTE